MENNSKPKLSTRERIINATLEIIGNEGFQNITIKKISELGHVNIAAVNYHFGSKDNVINEAMNILTQKLIKCFEQLDDKSIPPEERIRNFLIKYSDTGLEYPDVFRRIISDIINNSLIQFEYVEFLRNEGLIKMKDTLKEIIPEKDDDILLIRLFQMMGALEFPILIGDQTQKLSGLDYDNKEIRKKYIEELLRSLIST